MHTAEEYFAALADCLKEMPAAEREETLTYYREYAQEGGLLDAEQLREHFGPPSALAARILEDAAGKRESAQAPAGPAAPGKGRKPRLPLVLAVLAWVLVAASGLIVLAVGLHHDKTRVEGPMPTAPAASAAQTAAATPLPTATAENAGLPQSYDGTVAPFTEIAVDVVDADVRVEIGQDYALRYDLPEGETVQRMGVEGDILYLTSRAEPNTQNSQPGKVWITVPADTTLGDLRFSTVNGGVIMPELACTSVTVDNSSGDSTLDCLAAGKVSLDSTSGSLTFGGRCQELQMDSTSGSLDCTGQCDRLTLNAVSGSLTFGGSANSLTMGTVSGAARIDGAVTGEIGVTAISGNIEITAADPTVEARGTVIRYNGQRMSGNSWSRQGTGCTITAETMVGRISIEEP